MPKSLEQIKASKTYQVAVEAYGQQVADRAAQNAERDETPMIVALDALTDKLSL